MAKFHRSLSLTQSQRKDFKDKCKTIMAERGLTIPSLANEIGYSRKTVWQYFNDDDIDNKFLSAALDEYLSVRKSCNN